MWQAQPHVLSATAFCLVLRLHIEVGTCVSKTGLCLGNRQHE